MQGFHFKSRPESDQVRIMLLICGAEPFESVVLITQVGVVPRDHNWRNVFIRGFALRQPHFDCFAQSSRPSPNSGLQTTAMPRSLLLLDLLHLSVNRPIAMPTSLGDLKHDALVIASAHRRRTKDRSMGIDRHAAVGQSTVVTAGEVVQVGIFPTALARR